MPGSIFVYHPEQMVTDVYIKQSEQLLQWLGASRLFSKSALTSFSGPDLQELLSKSWEQRNEGPYQSYLQQVCAFNSSSSKKQEQEIAHSASDYELKSSLDIDPTIWNYGRNIKNGLQSLIWWPW